MRRMAAKAVSCSSFLLLRYICSKCYSRILAVFLAMERRLVFVEVIT